MRRCVGTDTRRLPLSDLCVSSSTTTSILRLFVLWLGGLTGLWVSTSCELGSLFLRLCLRQSCLLLEGLTDLLQGDNVGLLLLQGHLLLLVENTLLDDCVDLLDGGTWVVGQ